MGTSATRDLPAALAGAAGVAIAGQDAVFQPGLNSGFIVVWPAMAAIVVTSVLLAPTGARLARHLPRAIMQRVFTLIVLVVGLKMLGSAIF